LNKISVFPKPSEANYYISNLVNGLNKSVKFKADYISSGKQIHKIECDILYLNWLENKVIRKNFSKGLISFFYIIFSLWYVKNIKKRRIVMTYHNKIPHATKNNFFSKTLAKKTLRSIYNFSDLVIVHSKYAKDYCTRLYGYDKKVVFVPHGNYLPNYRPLDKEHSEKKRVVFLGQIRKYKGIESLIDTFKKISSKNVEFFIYGKPEDNSCKEKVLELTKSDNRIHCDLRFIEDKEIPKIFSRADVLVLPYSGESFLTSGSTILAFTMKTPVIAPNVAMFEDYKDEPFVFLFEDGNYESLKEQIERVIKINQNELAKIQEEAYQKIQNNTWDLYANILDGL
jgi:beta-1,4-mannosyltransferase